MVKKLKFNNFMVSYYDKVMKRISLLDQVSVMMSFENG
jgi:hypothetical protein